MTVDEILKNNWEKEYPRSPYYWEESILKKRYSGIAYDSMNEFADQKTKPLQGEIERLRKRLHDTGIERNEAEYSLTQVKEQNKQLAEALESLLSIQELPEAYTITSLDMLIKVNHIAQEALTIIKKQVPNN